MLEFNATFLVSMISFIVFIIIMNAIFYKPILGVIEERENFINDHYNDAKNSKDKAQSLLEQKEKRLNDTLSESKKIVSDKVNEANETAKSITDDAKADSANKIQSAKKELHEKEVQTAEELKNNVKDLAESISSKILGENITIDNIDYDIVNKVLK